MANPADVGTFDVWISDRLAFQTLKPKSGDTGDFDSWISDRLYWHDYVETAAAGETLSIAVTPTDSAYWTQGIKVIG